MVTHLSWETSAVGIATSAVGIASSFCHCHFTFLHIASSSGSTYYIIHNEDKFIEVNMSVVHAAVLTLHQGSWISML